MHRRAGKFRPNGESQTLPFPPLDTLWGGKRGAPRLACELHSRRLRLLSRRRPRPAARRCSGRRGRERPLQVPRTGRCGRGAVAPSSSSRPVRSAVPGRRARSLGAGDPRSSAAPGPALRRCFLPQAGPVVLLRGSALEPESRRRGAGVTLLDHPTAPVCALHLATPLLLTPSSARCFIGSLFANL